MRDRFLVACVSGWSVLVANTLIEIRHALVLAMATAVVVFWLAGRAERTDAERTDGEEA